MNELLQYIFFGTLLAAGGILGQQKRPRATASGLLRRLLSVLPQTKVPGLLYMFIVLWVLSVSDISGNDTLDPWQKILQYQWAALFSVVAMLAVWYGWRQNDAVLRGFGVNCLWTNLFVCDYKYFSHSVPTQEFFILLGLGVVAVREWWRLARR